MNDNVRNQGGGDVRNAPPADYHAFHDRGSAAKLSTTVVHALARAMGVDVTEAGFVLNDSVDPDALDRIFAETGDGTPRPPGHVGFFVGDYRVTVYSTGQIVITPPAHPSSTN